MRTAEFNKSQIVTPIAANQIDGPNFETVEIKLNKYNPQMTCKKIITKQ